LKGIYYEAKEKAGNPRFNVKGVQQYRNKVQRIATLEPDISNGHLLFTDNVNPKLIEQLALFPTTYDDGPDALQGAISELKEMTTEQLFERFYNQ
jgi:predicted phage terminase large subunit-like protein